MLKVAMELSCLTPERITGIGIYTENLTKNLKPLFQQSHSQLVGWIPYRKRHLLKNVTQRVPIHVSTNNELSRWFKPPTVVHGPDFKIPRFGRFRKVVTIHDLVEFETEFSSFKFMKIAQDNMRKMLFNCQPDFIICCSEFTKSRLLHFFPELEIPISVIHHGADHLIGPNIGRPRLVESSYILYVGTLEKRKNPQALIDAFETLKSKGTHPNLELVLAGGLGLGHEEILQKIRSSPAKNFIQHFQQLTHDQLLSLYQYADVFIFPSLYEGFGFPVLEAMKMRIPVICSDRSSLPEVAGRAALMVNPTAPREIVNAFETLKDIPGLQTDLLNRASEHCKTFTWKQTAENTLNVYARAYTL